MSADMTYPLSIMKVYAVEYEYGNDGVLVDAYEEPKTTRNFPYWHMKPESSGSCVSDYLRTYKVPERFVPGMMR